MNVIKTNIQNLAMLSAVVTFAACESNKKVEINENGTEVVTARTPQADTLDTEANPPMVTQTVEGKVLEVNFGKDGYTAKVETDAKEIYYVTVSHANLKDHKQYKEAKVGETIRVAGDHWRDGDEKDQITVRELF